MLTKTGISPTGQSSFSPTGRTRNWGSCWSAPRTTGLMAWRASPPRRYSRNWTGNRSSKPHSDSTSRGQRPIWARPTPSLSKIEPAGFVRERSDPRRLPGSSSAFAVFIRSRILLPPREGGGSGFRLLHGVHNRFRLDVGRVELADHLRDLLGQFQIAEGHSPSPFGDKLLNLLFKFLTGSAQQFLSR